MIFKHCVLKVKIPLFGFFAFLCKLKNKMGSKKKVAWNCSSSDNWSLKRKTQTFRRNVVEHMNSLLVVDTSADFPLEFSTKTYSGVASNSIFGANLHFVAKQIINSGSYNFMLCIFKTKEKHVFQSITMEFILKSFILQTLRAKRATCISK